MPGDALSPYTDDADLDDNAILLRRIRPDWVRWNETAPSGQWPRITSQNFQDYSEPMAARLGCPAPAMSIGVLSVLEAAGKDANELLIGYEGYGVASLTVGQIRVLGQGIVPWPTEAEPWHGLVFTVGGGVKSVGTRSRLAEAASWLIRPPRND